MYDDEVLLWVVVVVALAAVDDGLYSRTERSAEPVRM